MGKCRMEISVVSFTEKGIRLSAELAEKLEGYAEVALFTKCRTCSPEGQKHIAVSVHKSIGEWAKEQLEERKVLLFIGACGIAVRAVAPWLTDKLHDSPVLVMDEQGAYVIPILSGHMGGANEIALCIAEKMGAVPVITTATDLNGKFAVDIFAKKNGLTIVNKEGIARVSAKVLAGKDITIAIEPGHIGEGSIPPEYLHMADCPPGKTVDIWVGSEDESFDAAIWLRPKEYVIGMGCRRGKEAEKIEELIQRTLKETGISVSQIYALASIDRKYNEQGFRMWSRKAAVPFLTYTAEQLGEVEGQFHGSEFVEDRVGVDNVCERAALRACEGRGRLVYEKHAEDGMTIAVARREWSVRFDEA